MITAKIPENFVPDIDVSIEKIEEAIVAGLNGNPSCRLIAIMGPNGSGKTRVLRGLKNKLEPNYGDVIFLPSPRRGAKPLTVDQGSPQLEIPVGASLSKIAELIFERSQRTQQGGVPLEIQDALALLIDRAEEIDTANRSLYAQQCIEFSENQLQRGTSGVVGHPPAKPEKLIDTISNLIDDVLGYRFVVEEPLPPPSTQHFMARRLYRPEKRFWFVKGAAQFGFNDLSAGETQILGLLALLVHSSSDRKLIFLIDEPEVHLNEMRAIEVWERIEQQFPAAEFVYATHNVAFATREAIGALYLIGNDALEGPISENEMVPVEAIKSIVGARIQVLRSSKPIVFCEDSFAKLLLLDLLGEDVQIVVLDGCREVISTVKGDRGWSKIRTGSQRFCGVIDRDARSDVEAAHLEVAGIFSLPVNETESVLLVPAIARQIGKNKGVTIDQQAYDRVLIDCAQSALPKTTENLAKHCEQSIRPRLQYATRPITVRSDPNLVAVFEDRLKGLEAAIASRDTVTTLKHFDGKNMYTKMASEMRTSFSVSWPILAHSKQEYESLRAAGMAKALLHADPGFSDLKTKVRAHLALSP